MSLREDVLRYLRQRVELGESELILESLDPTRLADLIARLDDAPVPTAAAPVIAPHPTTGGAPAERASAPAAGTTEERAGALAVLAEQASGCTRCRLSESRTQVVFGDGTVTAEVMVVGEAPGADEDRTGVPFVGRAGRMLDLMLQAVGFPREQVYICNVLKCRPPGNRDPLADEVECCTPYLRRQIELIQPRVLLAVGRFAAQTLVGSDAPLGRLRTGVHSYEGVPVVVTYHPAYLLRSPDQVRRCWDDLQRLRQVVDRAVSAT